MATPTDFEGSTHNFGPPPGEEERCGRLIVFSNGHCNVSAWKPSESELKKLNEGEPIFVSHWTGVHPVTGAPVVFPTFVGTESEVAAVVSDFGKVWR